jgi:hypothetical protein
VNDGQNARGQTGREQESLDDVGGARCGGIGQEDDRVPRDERRDHIGRRECEGVVPRRDDTNDPDWSIVFDGTREKWNRAATASRAKEAGAASSVKMCKLCRIDGFFERTQSILVGFRLDGVQDF